MGFEVALIGGIKRAQKWVLKTHVMLPFKLNPSLKKEDHLMNSIDFKSLKDQELLKQTRELVGKERQLLTHVLHHLREVERRRLFSDLGYPSLFEYAVQELKYSEGQAGRRIQAMRLLKELPQIEEKVTSGALSLSNISQAQSFFREKEKEKGRAQERVTLDSGSVSANYRSTPKVSAQEKLEVLKILENCSAREGQKKLLKLEPGLAKPRERERVISQDLTEVSFVVTEELKQQLEEVRSLLGAKAVGLSWAELVAEMARLSLASLRVKKFGKKGAQEMQKTRGVKGKDKGEGVGGKTGGLRAATPTSELNQVEGHDGAGRGVDGLKGKRKRTISRGVQRQVWTRDEGRCRKCGTRRGLQWDHIRPVALGGESEAENLRILCASCNHREAIRVFGLQKMEKIKAGQQKEKENRCEL